VLLLSYPLYSHLIFYPSLYPLYLRR
jgi:hypothetical protein